MKRAVIMTICLTCLISLSAYGQWWKENFIIGTMYDPPANNDTDVVAHYNMAVSAGFNLFTGQLMSHSNHSANTVLNTYFQSIKDTPGRPFFFSQKGAAFNSDYDGKFVKDEPDLGDYSKYSSEINSIQSDPNKLAFVNLFPAYANKFSDWTENYIKYLDSFGDPSNIRLKVLCFDNYWPDNSFPSYNNHGNKRRYYSNLAAMRAKAGTRPLWSFVLTGGRILNFNSSYQRAYLRLSAFAPMAYGAKGILYYYYDQRDQYVVIRDIDYRSSNGWNSSVYYTIPDNVGSYDVFFGHFNSDGGSLAHADIGVKTDEQRGKWYMKYTSNETLLDNRAWDYENEWYDTSIIDYHFVTAWNDSLDHLATIRNDGMLLLSQNNKVWTDSTYLSGVGRSNFHLLNRKCIAGGIIKGGVLPDIAIGQGDTVIIYYDYSKQKGFVRMQKYLGFSNLRMLQSIRSVTGYDSLYAVCMASNGKNGLLWTYHSSTDKWSSKPISVNIASAGLPDHFWLEQYPDRMEVHMQDNQGRLYYGTVGSESVSIDQYNSSNSYSNYKDYYGIRNGSGKYDLYCIPVRSQLPISLINSFQKPTPLFGIVDTINHYLREQVASVVMNYHWDGCYHHRNYNKSDEEESIVSVVGVNTTVRALSNPNLMVGVFSDSSSKPRYLIVVNKGYDTIRQATVTVDGNYKDVMLKPRIDTGSMSCSKKYRRAAHVTEITWSSMTGGECVVVDLHR